MLVTILFIMGGIGLTCFVATYILLYMCNGFHPMIVVTDIFIIISLTFLSLACIDCSKMNIDTMTVYNAGNIEVSGKTCLFKKQDNERFSFSDYEVEKGSENACEGCGEVITITLTDKYYKQYIKTIENQESLTIKIKK